MTTLTEFQDKLDELFPHGVTMLPDGSSAVILTPRIRVRELGQNGGTIVEFVAWAGDEMTYVSEVLGLHELPSGAYYMKTTTYGWTLTNNVPDVTSEIGREIAAQRAGFYSTNLFEEES